PTCRIWQPKLVVAVRNSTCSSAVCEQRSTDELAPSGNGELDHGAAREPSDCCRNKGCAFTDAFVSFGVSLLSSNAGFRCLRRMRLALALSSAKDIRNRPF